MISSYAHSFRLLDIEESQAGLIVSRVSLSARIKGIFIMFVIKRVNKKNKRKINTTTSHRIPKEQKGLLHRIDKRLRPRSAYFILHSGVVERIQGLNV